LKTETTGASVAFILHHKQTVHLKHFLFT